MASSAVSGAPFSASSRRRSFHRSCDFCEALSMSASVVRYTEATGPGWRSSAPSSGAETATCGVTPEVSMVAAYPFTLPVMLDAAVDSLDALAVQEVDVTPTLRHAEIYTLHGLLTLFWHGAQDAERVVVTGGG